MYFQGRKVTLEGRNATLARRCGGGEVEGGLRVRRGRSSLCRAATGQSSASGLHTADVYLLITGNLGNRRARRGETNKQTKKKKSHNSTGDAADARSSPAKKKSCLVIPPTSHHSLPAARSRFSLTLPLSNRFACCRRRRRWNSSFFFFLASQTLAGT